MIYVTYDGGSRLEVRGHARSGPKGRDLVCAGVTALVLTLRENCREAELRSGYAKLSGGSGEIFRGVSRGFALLAKNFPQCVHYKCLEERSMRP